MSSLEVRGSSQKIRISFGGVIQATSFKNIINFKETPKYDKKVVQRVGEKRDAENVQIRGYNLTWSLYEEDAACQAALEQIQAAYDAGQPFPDVTITVITTYLNGVVSATAYHPCTATPDDRDNAGATELIKWSWSAFAEEREKLL